MKLLGKTSLAALLFMAGTLPGLCEPSFWKNSESPTPTALKPPQVAPVEEDTTPVAAKADANAPVTMDAPALGEATPAPTPEAGKHPKSPTTAGLLSAILPGAGHVYTAQPLRGVVIAGAFGLTLWQSLENFKKLPGSYDSKNATAGQLYALAAIAAYGFGVQDAYDCANRYNRKFHLHLTVAPRGTGLQVACRF